MSSKGVLHVITSQSWGGLELYVAALINQMHQHQMAPLVAASGGSQIQRQLTQTDIPCLILHTGTFASVKNFLLLWKYVNQHQVQCVHTHTNKDAKLLCLLAWCRPGLKHVFSLYMGASNKRDWLHLWLYKKINALISSSERTNQEVAQMYPLRPEKIHLIRYGRDAGLYKKDGTKRNFIRTQYGVTEADVVVTSMARFDPAKGIQELVESFVLLPEHIRNRTHYFIVGERNIINTKADGTKEYEPASEALYNYVQQFVTKHKLMDRVHIIPFQKDYISYLDASDIFILASWYEMYSLSVIDAMCMGLPVLGSNTGGTLEQVVHEKRGLNFEAKSAVSIAEAITRLHQDKELGARLAAEAQKWALQNHTWKNVLEAFDRIYKKLTNR